MLVTRWRCCTGRTGSPQSLILRVEGEGWKKLCGKLGSQWGVGGASSPRQSEGTDRKIIS